MLARPTDSIDADTLRSKIDCCALGETHNSMLGHSVGGAFRHACQACDGCYIDDTSAGLHQIQLGFHA